MSESERNMIAVKIAEYSIPEPTTGCWLWERCTLRTGYGEVFWDFGERRARQVHKAHRLSFFAATGAWPQVVRHRCDQPACVNPEHLLGGTHADNIADMDRRGRRKTTPGELSGRAKLTASDVREIRTLKGSASQREIASRYGVDHSIIGHIFRDEIWRSVT